MEEDKLKYIRYMRATRCVDDCGRVWLPITHMHLDFEIKDDRYKDFTYNKAMEIREIIESCRYLGAKSVGNCLAYLQIDVRDADINKLIEMYEYCRYANIGKYFLESNILTMYMRPKNEVQTPITNIEKALTVQRFKTLDIEVGLISVEVNSEYEYVEIMTALLIQGELKAKYIDALKKLPNQYPQKIGDGNLTVNYNQIVDCNITLISLERLKAITNVIGKFEYNNTLGYILVRINTKRDYKIYKDIVFKLTDMEVEEYRKSNTLLLREK